MESQFIKRLQGPFASSSTVTPEWRSFFTFAKKHFNKTLAEVADRVEIFRGHFCIHGFFTRKLDGQIFYFSFSDVRCGVDHLMIRTAKSYEDYTGGTNNNIRLDATFEKRLLSFIEKHPVLKSNAEIFINRLNEEEV